MACSGGMVGPPSNSGHELCRLRVLRDPDRYARPQTRTLSRRSARSSFTTDRMGRRRALLDPADMRGRGIEVDLIPAKVGRPQAMPEDQDHGGVAVTVPPAGGLSRRSISAAVRCSRLRYLAFIAEHKDDDVRAAILGSRNRSLGDQRRTTHNVTHEYAPPRARWGRACVGNRVLVAWRCLDERRKPRRVPKTTGKDGLSFAGDSHSLAK
jgi:hypothetical protein